MRVNERTSEQTSPALYASISGHFYPECRGGGLAVAMAVAMAAVQRWRTDGVSGGDDGGGAQWDGIV